MGVKTKGISRVYQGGPPDIFRIPTISFNKNFTQTLPPSNIMNQGKNFNDPYTLFPEPEYKFFMELIGPQEHRVEVGTKWLMVM